LSELEECRSKIRETDKEILTLIEQRLTTGTRLAGIKRQRKLPIIDSVAEQAVINNLVKSADELGIDERFARRLGGLLIEETVRVEDRDQPATSKDQLMKQMFELTQKLMSEGRKIISFEIGEPNFPTPKKVIQGLDSTFRKKKVIGYGPAAGLLQLRQAIAVELNRQHKTTIDPDQILITPGARFAIFATITSYVSSLERVVIPQPAWPAYEECVNFVGGRVIPLKTNFEDNWDIDSRGLEAELEKGVRLLILNSPSNPTGKVISKQKFEKIVDLAERYNTMILSDEVYDRYVRSPAPSILGGKHQNFVYVNSFSKQFSLTGWRIAYLVSSRENVLKIRRVLQTAVTCVPEFIQNAALVAMKRARNEAERQIKTILEKVDFTCDELSKIDVSFNRPEGAFYVFPKANKPKFDSTAFAKRLLEKYGVSITPGQSFGDYPEFFRLAVSLPKVQIPAAVKSIGEALNSWP